MPDCSSASGETVAGSAESAIDKFEEADGEFDLVFADVVLPGQSGLQLVEQRGAFLRELIAEMVLDASQREFQIRQDEFPGTAADDGHEDHMPATPRDGAMAR